MYGVGSGAGEDNAAKDVLWWKVQARAEFSGDGVGAARRAGAGDVAETHALEATHWVSALSDTVVNGEAPEAAFGEPF